MSGHRVVDAVVAAGPGELVALCRDGSLWHGTLTAGPTVEWVRLEAPPSGAGRPPQRVLAPGVVAGPRRGIESVPEELKVDRR